MCTLVGVAMVKTELYGKDCDCVAGRNLIGKQVLGNGGSCGIKEHLCGIVGSSRPYHVLVCS